MKLIIDIPEDLYRFILQHGIKDTHEIDEVIANGTPLPKGHGRLVDENSVIAQLVWREHLLADNVKCGEVTKIFDSAVVIEADKENDNEANN